MNLQKSNGENLGKKKLFVCGCRMNDGRDFGGLRLTEISLGLVRRYLDHRGRSLLSRLAPFFMFITDYRRVAALVIFLITTSMHLGSWYLVVAGIAPAIRF